MSRVAKKLMSRNMWNLLFLLLTKSFCGSKFSGNHRSPGQPIKKSMASLGAAVVGETVTARNTAGDLLKNHTHVQDLPLQTVHSNLEQRRLERKLKSTKFLWVVSYESFKQLMSIIINKINSDWLSQLMIQKSKNPHDGNMTRFCYQKLITSQMTPYVAHWRWSCFLTD